VSAVDNYTGYVWSSGHESWVRGGTGHLPGQCLGRGVPQGCRAFESVKPSPRTMQSFATLFTQN